VDADENLVYAGRLEDLPVIPTEDHGGAEKRIVFGPGRFWEDYVARLFTIRQGATTPFHAHDWPHYVLILEGTAKGMIMGQAIDLSAGSWAFVPPNTDHFFENAGSGDLKFICIVPKKGDTYWLDSKGSC
jgi:quercetin dioxygenase-like cupin family protein